jgi:regulator of sigma E protease
MLAILAPVLVFGLVIFVHELGHFLAAKAVGVYAPRFSIGFGPSIFKFRRGETEYILAWLPLGGYVRMASRHDAETAFLEGGTEEQTARKEDEPGYDPNAMIPFGPKPVPEDRWFESKPLWARIVIMIAGVVMNVLLALAVAIGLVMSQGRQVVPTTVIGAVETTDAVPQLSELRQGDSIIAVNGVPVATWNDVHERIMASESSVAFTTQRGTATVPVPDKGGALSISDHLVYRMPAVIDTVFAGDPASAAGVQKGDSIVRVAGKPVASWTDVVAVVSASPGVPVDLEIMRGGALQTLRVTPKAVREPDPSTGQQRDVGKIGAGTRNLVRHEQIGFGEAVSEGAKITVYQAGMVFRVLKQIGSGEQSLSQLGGPIAITKAAVDAGKSGISRVFDLIALLSINVAVLNLLPIPILDGGQIVINVLESAKGSPFSTKTREYILRFGLLAIALLFVIVMYNDTRGAFVKLFDWVGKAFGA